MPDRLVDFKRGQHLFYIDNAGQQTTGLNAAPCFDSCQRVGQAGHQTGPTLCVGHAARMPSFADLALHVLDRVSPLSMHPVLGERLSMVHGQLLPSYIGTRIYVFEEFAPRLGAVFVIVHAYDSGLIEEPKILRG